MTNTPHFCHPGSLPKNLAPRFAVSAMGLLCLLLALAGCGGEKEAAHRPPAPVTTVQAKAMDTPVTIKAVGNVKASNSVTVKSRVDGHIMRIHFLDGDMLTAGQLLYTIDPETYIYTQRGAQASVASDRATAEYARKEYLRYKDLYDQNVISRDEYEVKLTAYETARKAMEADSAQVDIASRNVKFTQITSPINGMAGSTLLDEGNLVGADKDELVVIKTLAPADVQFSVPGFELPRIRAEYVDNQLTVLATPALSGAEPARGVLTFMDNWVNPDTGMINLKARFPNQDTALWPGQFVTIDLILSIRENAVRVPAQAVQRGPDGRYIFVVEDGKAKVRPVVPGLRVDEEVVIDSGLAAGETVVVEGMLRLFPDAPVAIKNAPPAPGTDANATKGQENS
ncbi:efflux RND transporter periplasmic adaptor subunit [Pseudodesulfovibrio pelocollis]|uniref:efflux RND transporter periplasmic adaptor subunit n=1 Tax=Pseudodesulfovibrio pelocollis TaxID=3051432 RepID=UPI00255B05C4|nr:efflux RND transporter periplasmic adaptor subunit [Pseudodesulfovibrio sp. SB368]